ncbi:MAG: proline--tRNA ligase [Eubacteriales bacterium]|nr:proline--tRNA ligase [Eubacteriales bacterium]
MRLSRSFFYTLREDARDEESVGGNLLVRAGMIRKTSSGVYMMMPLGFKCLNKIMGIIREEMERAGSQELFMPALLPEDVYVESGRRENFGKSMFSLKDRFSKSFVLAPTHEELFADAARMAIHSYKDLPLNLYQIQTKFRDEPRPRFGLIRVREFFMKDAYSFDADLEGLDQQYQAMFDAYKRIFDRVGLKYVIVRADTGAMGGLLSEEFQALSDIGEDTLVLEPSSNYASNIEVAHCVLEGEKSTEAELSFEKVHTPNMKTIEEVASFFGLEAKRFVKTLVYKVDEKLYAFCLRGDHEVNETKVLKLLGANEMELATAEEIARVSSAPIGSMGPIGLEIPVILDQEVTLLVNFIVGANEADYHYKNANLGDFKPLMTADIRKIKEGDLCENRAGRVVFKRGIEVGNTFKLGDKYSKAMDLYYRDQNNESHPVVMGSYGIGPARLMAAIVEQCHGDGRMFWPKNIAPIQVAIIPVSAKNPKQTEVAEALYETLQSKPWDVVLDDRNERAGVKFTDMELVGAYVRITCGRSVDEGKVEIKYGHDDHCELVDIEAVPAFLEDIFSQDESC